LMVTLNHVYFSQQGNVSVTGITQRYKDKFTTIVLYKPAPEKKDKDTGKENDGKKVDGKEEDGKKEDGKEEEVVETKL
jgi:hypothetical protein